MVPSGANSLPLYDFGPGFEHGLLTREPPDVADASGYAVLVPAVDADGNDVAGVRAPMVEAPLGTCTGWNLRARGFGHGAMHEFTGSYIPFPDTDSEAAMTGDPRASVLARYRDADGYQRAIEAAARRLVGRATDAGRGCRAGRGAGAGLGPPAARREAVGAEALSAAEIRSESLPSCACRHWMNGVRRPAARDEILHSGYHALYPGRCVKKGQVEWRL